MAGFIPINYGGKKPPAAEFLPAGAITPKIGLCLGFNTAGNLVAHAKPAYICMTEGDTLTAGTMIPVQKIDSTYVYEAELDGVCALKVGDFVDVDSTGLKVDADTTTNKVLQLLTTGTAAGDKVSVRFVEPNGADPA